MWFWGIDDVQNCREHVNYVCEIFFSILFPTFFVFIKAWEDIFAQYLAAN